MVYLISFSKDLHQYLQCLISTLIVVCNNLLKFCTSRMAKKQLSKMDLVLRENKITAKAFPAEKASYHLQHQSQNGYLRLIKELCTILE